MVTNAEYAKRWREKHPERAREVGRNYAKRHPDRLRERRLKRDYGITIETYELLRMAQENGCAICRGPSVDRKHFDVDHNHETGKVRGLLCHHCNKMLGHVRDNPAVLEAAARYVRER